MVDDFACGLELTTAVLELEGFETLTAATGEEALRRAMERPDLIILDVNLPDFDGFEVCRRLKVHPATASIPVLYLSGAYRESDDRVRGLEDGADGYLTKPVVNAELIATVRSVLRRSHENRPTRDSERAEEAARVLAEVGRELTASQEFTQATHRLVAAVRNFFRARRASFYELDRAAGVLVCVATAGEEGPSEWLGRPLRLGEGTEGRAVLEARPITSADISDDLGVALDEPLRERLDASSYGAVVSVPLIAHGDVLGVLSLLDWRGRAFSDDDIQRLSAFADQAALALRSARLYREAERQLQMTRGLLAVAQTLGTSLDRQELARRGAREITRLLGADTSMFLEIDESGAQAEVVAAYRLPELLRTFSPRIAVSEMPRFFREAIETQSPVAADDVAGDPRLDHPVIRSLPMIPRAMLYTPILSQGRVTGGLLTCWWSQPHRFTDEEIGLTRAVTHQLALSLENARLYADAGTRLTRMKRLAGLSHLVAASREAREVLEFTATAAVDLLPGDLASLWLVNAESGALERVVQTERADGVTRPAPPTAAPFGEALARQSIEQNALCEAPDLLREPCGVERDETSVSYYASQVAVPLRIGTRAEGALTVLTRQRRRFSEEDIELLETFADKAAAAVDKERCARAAQEAQDHLLQAQKMDAIGHLSAGVAHDFNNILTVISGRSQLMLRRLKADDPLYQAVETIQESSRRAASLTHQLLAFSRKQVLSPRVIDLNGVVGHVSTLLARLIGEHIHMRLELADSAALVHADPTQLEQVLLNLVVNARDAMADGGKLTIQTAVEELRRRDLASRPALRPGRYVVLTVRDTGCGIDEKVRQRIFEPFFSTKEKGKGTGLGLATVYGIVKQSGGHIEVESAVARGTTFRIYLSNVEESAGGDPAGAAGVAANRGKTVLLIERDAQVRALVREVLEVTGFTVIEAEDERTARAARLRDGGEVDLVVADVVSEAGGCESCRPSGPRPDTKERAIPEAPAADRAQGGCRCPRVLRLDKPFAPDALIRRVRAVLGARPDRG